MCTWSIINLQDSNSPTIENLIFFHNYSLLILLIITVNIIYIIGFLLINKLTNKFIIQNQIIEIIWTLIPITILIFIAFPSLKILYLTDELNSPILSIKIIGHQWYWSYEYSDFKDINFNSYIITLDNIKNFNFRLLDVDNNLVIPFNTPTRLIISSSDVIHSWTIPSLGVKIDSIPGRINQTTIQINRPGILYGQCSEICGINHSFIPIVIESTSNNLFIQWIKNLLLDDWNFKYWSLKSIYSI